MLLLTALAAAAPPAPAPLTRLADEITASVDRLASEPSLSTWRQSFPADKLELAHYETDRDPYQFDFTRLASWCAGSVATVADQSIRAALFSVPDPGAGRLPILPLKQDSRITGECRAQALWYGVESRSFSALRLVRELAKHWGAPNGTSAKAALPGSSLWIEVSAWHRSGLTLWVAYDRQTWKGNAARPELVVYARRDLPPKLFLPMYSIGTFFDPSAAAQSAARIAALDPALTTPIVAFATAQPFPPQMSSKLAAQQFERWFLAGKNLPPRRRAAVLFLADLYLSRTQRDEEVDRQYSELGARFDGGCPQDGPAYANNFLQQAAKLDPRGPIGEWSHLRALASPCLLPYLLRGLVRGRKTWADLLLDQSAAMLQNFPRSQHAPYYHFVLARAHAIKLMYSYPYALNAELDASYPVPAAQAPAHRAEAIRQFRLFLRQKPNAPESPFAWQEAWRLLAGLPPTLINFGCGCE